MDAGFLADLTSKYDAYVDAYRAHSSLALPPMMELKRVHTAHVVDNAKLIAEGEGFDAETARACEAAALLHDTGRYEQLKRYNTFRDSDSVDHAVFSHDIVVEKGWLDGDPQREAILTAVLVHNRRDVPDAFSACWSIRLPRPIGGRTARRSGTCPRWRGLAQLCWMRFARAVQWTTRTSRRLPTSC